MSDFMFNGTSTKNIRLKWVAVCLNLDYDNNTIQLFFNGEKSPQIDKKPLTLPGDHQDKPLIIRMGRYYYDDTPLIGKIVDINIWDRWGPVLFTIFATNSKAGTEVGTSKT